MALVAEFRVVETNQRGSGLEFGQEQTLFSYPIIDRGEAAQSRTYDVGGNGDRVLAITVPDADLPRQIEFVTNWVSGLEHQAPGGRP